MPFALPHLAAGFIAVMVGYTSSVILIIQAATAAGDPMQPSSRPGYGTVIAGLGGRPIPKKSLTTDFVEKINAGANEEIYFLDLKTAVVEQELAGLEAERKAAKRG